MCNTILHLLDCKRVWGPYKKCVSVCLQSLQDRENTIPCNRFEIQNQATQYKRRNAQGSVVCVGSLPDRENIIQYQVRKYNTIPSNIFDKRNKRRNVWCMSGLYEIKKIQYQVICLKNDTQTQYKECVVCVGSFARRRQ